MIFMTNICTVCGKEFEAIKSTKKYCSDACMYQARKQRNQERKITGISGLKEKKCPICGKTFTPKNAAAN